MPARRHARGMTFKPDGSSKQPEKKGKEQTAKLLSDEILSRNQHWQKR